MGSIYRKGTSAEQGDLMTPERTAYIQALPAKKLSPVFVSMLGRGLVTREDWTAWRKVWSDGQKHPLVQTALDVFTAPSDNKTL